MLSRRLGRDALQGLLARFARQSRQELPKLQQRTVAGLHLKRRDHGRPRRGQKNLADTQTLPPASPGLGRSQVLTATASCAGQQQQLDHKLCAHVLIRTCGSSQGIFG